MSEIIYKIELAPPAECETGPGRLHVIRGYCFHPQKRTIRLDLFVGEESLAIEEFDDFRPDVSQEFADRDQAGASLLSGFFASLEAAPRLAGSEQSLALAITLDDGSRERVEIGTIRFLPPQQKASGVPAAKLAICLATWNPEPEAFTRQIDSLIAQDFSDWVCIVNDDCSARTLYTKIREICSRDPRFHLFRNDRNFGFYRNFETALGRVPTGVEYIALCDQDDIWNPDKLSSCLAAFGAHTQLVYCDMRIVRESGAIVAPSYWVSRRNQYRDLDVLLTANTVTGAASVFRAKLLAKLLPFPERIGDAFHDHWIACCALAGGGIGYVARPLYDYVQHETNVIGHSNFDQLPTLMQRLKRFVRGAATIGRLRARLVPLRYALLSVVNMEYRRVRLIAETLRLRFNETPSLTPSLSMFLPANPWGAQLMLRHFSPRFSRSTTGNAELRMGAALAARRFNSRYVRWRARSIVARIRRAQAAGRVDRMARGELSVIADKIAPLMFATDRAAPRRVNFLVPEISFENFFGGYMGKFNLARKIAEAGFQVRIVIVDWCDVRPERWRALVNRYEGLAGFFNYVEVAYCFDRKQALTVNPDDGFLASTWWTAHIAADAMRQLARARDETQPRPFTYLIQEYEPFTFPMGTLYALANQSYTFPHNALFSTGLLEEYFRERAIGVFATGRCEGAAAACFQNAILQFDVDAAALAARTRRKLLFYARPEGHAARNMFEIGMLALEKAVANGAFGLDPWSFHGIGTSHGDIELDTGGVLKMLGKLSLDEYQALLPQYDVGLSLMYTPHPSLVPLEMAAAGMLSVTNTCLNKTAGKLAAISTNLIAANPTIGGVAGALAQAANRVGDIDGRVRGSQVNWPSNWDTAFHPDLMQLIGGWLEPAAATSIK